MRVTIWIKRPNGEEYAITRKNNSVGFDATLLEEVAQLMKALHPVKISKVNSKPIVELVEEDESKDDDGGAIFEM